MEINFSNFRIVVQNGFDNRLLQIEDVRHLLHETNFKEEYKGIVYDISISLIDDKYMWITAKYGNPNPCPSQVLDKDSFEYKNNTRTSNLVEMRNQFFALFDFEKNILYLSNNKKKKFIEEFLKNKLDLGISINRLFVDIEEFNTKIKELRTIRFTSQDNLFNQNSTLNNAFKDLLGYGSNIDFKIEINCIDKPLDKGSILTNLKKRFTNQELTDLFIVGQNEEKFEEIFNSGTFNKKVIVIVSENEENLVNGQEVLSAIMEKI